MKHGDVEDLVQAFLDFKASGSADILQVDAAEARGKPGDGLYDLFRILGIQADGDGVDAAELFKQHGLAFHHRHGCMGADVSEPKYGASVGDHGNRVCLHGVAVGGLCVRGDDLAGLGYPGGVGDGQGFPGVYR